MDEVKEITMAWDICLPHHKEGEAASRLEAPATMIELCPACRKRIDEKTGSLRKLGKAALFFAQIAPGKSAEYRRGYTDALDAALGFIERLLTADQKTS